MSREKKRKLLVTGGAGFIGSHLVDELLAKNYVVTVLDNLRNGSMSNLKSAATNPDFKFVKGDVLNMEDCHNALADIDVVYHLACLGVRHSIHSPIENHEVNASGTLNMLEASRQLGVKKFFYISTSEVYGSTDCFPIKENASTQPNTVYGASKLVGEYYAQAYAKCYSLDTTVLRIFNNYGPRAHYQGDAGEVIPRTIVNALHGIQPIIFGDGTITRDFFYVKDTARALSELIDNSKIKGMTLNIGTGKEYTMREVIEKILELMGKTAMGIRYLEDRPADVVRLWVDASMFYALTDFKADYSFEQGLVQAIDYYSKLLKEGNLETEIIEKNWECER